MNQGAMTAMAFAAVAAGGAAYVFIYPLLSGEKRAEKRQKALLGAPDRKGPPGAAGPSRREQVAQSLKELETREKGRNQATIEMRIAQAGLSWTKGRFYAVSGIVGLTLGFLLLLTSGPLIALGGAFVEGSGCRGGCSVS